MHHVAGAASAQVATNPAAGSTPQPPPSAAPAATAAAVITVSEEPKSLSAALAEAHLSQYETALRELGAAFVPDLADLEAEDLVGIGMKKLEA